jgi:hypothetical protein
VTDAARLGCTLENFWPVWVVLGIAVFAYVVGRPGPSLSSGRRFA